MDPDTGPGPGTRKTWTLNNLAREKLGKTVGCKKKIGRPHSIIYYKEETCKQAIWKNSYWGFLGMQEMCLRLRVKMDSKAINK